MTIRIQCPTCRAAMRVNDELAGRRVRCGACKSILTIPKPPDEDDLADLITEAVEESQAADSYPGLPSRPARRRKIRKKTGTSAPDDAELSKAALWSLILGVVALFCCGLLTGIPAVIAGIIALVNIGNSGGRLRGKGHAFTGMTLGIVGPIVVAALLFQMGGPAMIRERFASAARNSARNKNNLKQIVLALHNYHDSNSTFPPGGVFDKQGTGAHGWQTFLLPYMEQRALYEQIDFHVPWNDSKNAPVFRTEVNLFLISDLDEKREAAGYAVSHYAGNSHLFGRNTRVRISNITDGTSNTLFAGEAAGNYKPWGHPENWRDPAGGIGKGPDTFGTSRGAFFALTDGSVRFISATASPELLRALATPAGAENLEALDFSNHVDQP